jgi:hypothetical protein
VLRPRLVATELLAEEDVGAGVLEHPAQGGSDGCSVLRRAERSELVGRAVADQTENANSGFLPDVEREQRKRRAASPAARGHDR